MDKISKQDRSKNMSKIRGRDTKPELLFRKELYRKGFRYRIHYKITGRPDVVFLKKKIAIFVNGCFWHGHDCIDGHIPKTNKKYWKEKISENKQRDHDNIKCLEEEGWKVIEVWECELSKKSFDPTLEKIVKLLIGDC